MKGAREQARHWEAEAARLTGDVCRLSRVSHADGHAIIAGARRERMGFLTKADVQMLVEDARTRLQLVLVRCGGCRFLAPAQDVAHLVDIISTEGRDYVRDFSLPAEVTP